MKWPVLRKPAPVNDDIDRRDGRKFIVSDFSAIEARVIAHLRQKGKIAELALGYGGSVGALKAMGALDMGLKEEELQPLVSAWRQSNPNIVAFWWDVDDAVKTAIRMRTATETHGIRFAYQSAMLFIQLPSGRWLAYVKPKIGENEFGGESVTYEGVGATKKWERIESYGPKFVENIVQAISRDILCYAMKTLSHCFICGHIHDELIIEASRVWICRQSVNRWGRYRHGFREPCCGPTGTRWNGTGWIKLYNLRPYPFTDRAHWHQV